MKKWLKDASLTSGSCYFYLFFFSFLTAFLANCIYLLIYSFFYDLICKMAVTYRILFYIFLANSKACVVFKRF